MKKIYLMLVLSCIAFAGNAQTATDYLFTATTGTYASISGTGGVVSATILGDDVTHSSIPIGFTFKFCGTNYTQLSACSNGWISLANSSSTTYANTAPNIPGAGFLMPFWGELFGMSSTAYYVATGSSPNRVFTFEWNSFATMTGNINFQVKLYETSNIVEFMYGSSTSTSFAHAIGIANSTSNWQSLPNSGSAPIPSSSAFANTLNFPASGQIYRWQAKCTGAPVPGALSASLTSGCVAYSSNLAIGSVPADILGLSYQWKTGPTASGPWTNVAGATNTTYTASVTGSIYYTCNVACSYSGLNTDATAIQLLINAPAPITGPDTVCTGATITVADATPGGTWASSNTAVATISSGGVVTPIAVGSTTISYTATGCTATKNVYVNALPSAGTISGSYFVCSTPITFTVSATGGVWGISNPSVAGVSTVGAVFAIAPGLATVTYSVTNGCGTSTASFPINTTPCLNSVAPITNDNELKLHLSPNPSSGAFSVNIQSPIDGPAYLTISDLLGKEVKTLTTITNKTETFSSALPAGVYIITVSTDQGKDFSKLIIQ